VTAIDTGLDGDGTAFVAELSTAALGDRSVEVARSRVEAPGLSTVSDAPAKTSDAPDTRFEFGEGVIAPLYIHIFTRIRKNAHVSTRVGSRTPDCT